MTGTSRVVAGAAVCAVVSLLGVAGGPAHADDGVAGAVPTVGGVIGNAGGTLGSTAENLGGTAGGAVGGTGSAVGATVGGPVGDTVGGTVRGVTDTVGGTVHSTTTTVAGTVDPVVTSTGGRLPQQQPPSSKPTTSRVTPPATTEHQPRTAVVEPPATASHRISRKRERAGQVPMSPAAVVAAHRLILASVRPEWLHRSAVAGPEESTEVAMSARSYDESCRSTSLSFADLRRCAHASMLIPQLGGPASLWLLLSVAMVGTGVALVARRRRGDTVGTPVG